MKLLSCFLIFVFIGFSSLFSQAVLQETFNCETLESHLLREWESKGNYFGAQNEGNDSIFLELLDSMVNSKCWIGTSIKDFTEILGQPNEVIYQDHDSTIGKGNFYYFLSPEFSGSREGHYLFVYFSDHLVENVRLEYNKPIPVKEFSALDTNHYKIGPRFFSDSLHLEAEIPYPHLMVVSLLQNGHPIGQSGIFWQSFKEAGKQSWHLPKEKLDRLPVGEYTVMLIQIWPHGGEARASFLLEKVD